MVGKRVKILVVDDEHLVRWSVCRFLESEGFTVVEASSGPEALKILQNEDISILITDAGYEWPRAYPQGESSQARTDHICYYRCRLSGTDTFGA